MSEIKIYERLYNKYVCGKMSTLLLSNKNCRGILKKAHPGRRQKFRYTNQKSTNRSIVIVAFVRSGAISNPFFNMKGTIASGNLSSEIMVPQM